MRQGTPTDALLVSIGVGSDDAIDLLAGRIGKFCEEPFPKDVIDLAGIQIDRRDGFGTPGGLLLEIGQLCPEVSTGLIVSRIKGGHHDDTAFQLHRC